MALSATTARRAQVPPEAPDHFPHLPDDEHVRVLFAVPRPLEVLPPPASASWRRAAQPENAN